MHLNGDNGNVQSHDQEESKLNNKCEHSGARTLTHDKIIKSPFSKNNVATIDPSRPVHF